MTDDVSSDDADPLAYRVLRHVYRRAARRYLSWRLQSGSSEFIFIIAHMRSGSSLLLHLLSSSDEAVGYGESHRNYDDFNSYVENAYHIYRRSGRLTLNSRYIVDKLLSETQLSDTSLLREAPAKVILLARRPEQALPSLLETGWDMVNTEEKALEHYRERLVSLRNIARVLEPSQGVFVTYGYLVSETASALPELSHFLDLDEVLTENYQTMWSTGVAGLGDTSRRIEEGRVVREQRAYSVQVDETIMAEARHLLHDLMGAVERLALPKVSGSEGAE